MSTLAIPSWRLPRSPAAHRPPALLLAAKLVVAAMLSATLVLPAAGGFHGQALWLRGCVYAVGLALIPVVWMRRPGGPYPIAADSYLLIPFAFDAAGNTLGLYSRVDNFDNLAHLVGTFALTGFAGSLLTRRAADPIVAAMAAAGAAAMLGIGIELAEWTAFAHPVATGFAAYRDTIGDLAMDIAGCGLGAVLVCAAPVTSIRPFGSSHPRRRPGA